MCDDFCLIHGYDGMYREFGNPISHCRLCEDDDACTCTMSSVNSASIDPPHEVVNKNCPIHGNAAARDPDAAYEASRDDPPEPFWMEDDS